MNSRNIRKALALLLTAGMIAGNMQSSFALTGTVNVPEPEQQEYLQACCEDGASVLIKGDLPDGAKAYIEKKEIDFNGLCEYAGEEKALSTGVYASYDIGILLDGEKYEPAEKVSVTLNVPGITDCGSDIELLHITEKNRTATPSTASQAVKKSTDSEATPSAASVKKYDPARVSVLRDGDTEPWKLRLFSFPLLFAGGEPSDDEKDCTAEDVDIIRQDGAVIFETEGFSEFVVFTVDFRYNGLTYRLKGESSVLLSELLSGLGLGDGITGCTGVWFSDPSLLEAAPSGDDWLLTSLASFDTEEELSLILPDGRPVTVSVTDPVPEYLTLKAEFEAGPEYVAVEEKLRPQSYITVNVTNKATGKRTTKWLYKRDNWELTDPDFPLRDAAGNPIEYTVEPGSKYVYYINDANVTEDTATVTYSFVPVQDVTYRLEWDDQNDYYGWRPKEELQPEDITLTHRYGNLSLHPTSVTPLGDGTYDVRFAEMPTYYTGGNGPVQVDPDDAYYWMAACSKLPPAYITSVSGRTTSRPRKIILALSADEYKGTFSISSIHYNGNQYSTADAFHNLERLGYPVPNEVTFTLYDGDEPADCVENPVVVLKRDADGGWTGSYSAVWKVPNRNEDGTPRDNSGLHIEWSSDVDIDGEFPKNYRVSDSDYGRSRNITIRSYGIYRHSVDYNWVDEGNALGIRPSAAEIQMLADGQPIPGIVPGRLAINRDSASWQPTAGSDFLLDRLPSLDTKGRCVRYTPEVSGLPAYYRVEMESSPEYSETTGYASNLDTYCSTLKQTVKLIADLTPYELTVDWECPPELTAQDRELEKKVRPATVVMTLYTSSDGGTTWKEFFGNSAVSVSYDAATDSYHKTVNLPAVDAEGNDIIYKAVEAPLSVYDTEYSEIDYTKDTPVINVKNTYKPDWDFFLDLMWVNDNPDYWYDKTDVTTSYRSITQTAKITVQTNMSYQPGELEVRLPYAVFVKRDGTYFYPNGSGDISVPMAPATNDSWSYNYTIDKHDSSDPGDWELVFANWQALKPGQSTEIPFRYVFDSWIAPDFTEIHLKAVGTALSSRHESREITYKLDTGLTEHYLYKTVHEFNDADPDNDGCLYRWSSTFGAEPADFDTEKYNYVVYRIGFEDYTGKAENNIFGEAYQYSQPFGFEITDTPGDNGRIVSVKSTNSYFELRYGDHENGVYRSYDYDENGKYISSTEFQDTWKVSYGVLGWYVVVAYPRDEAIDPVTGKLKDNVVYHNSFTGKIVALDRHPGDKEEGDKNDIYLSSGSATAPWRDYKWVYKGDIFNASKNIRSEDCALDVLAGGERNCIDYVIVSSTVSGYSFTDGYRFVLNDDAFALNKGSYNYILLEEGEYEITETGANRDQGIEISMTASDVDRSTGDTIEGEAPDGPFILEGRKGGAWEELSEITMTSASYRGYAAKGLVTGKGYTALRLRSPEGVTGRFDVSLDFNMALEPDAPRIKALAQDPAVKSVTAYNMGSFELYTPDPDGSGKEILYSGEKNWPKYSYRREPDKTLGLFEADKERLGDYTYRFNSYTTLSRVTIEALPYKTVLRTDIDAASGTVTTRFLLKGYERLSLNSWNLPDSLKKRYSHDEAYLYDLLPQGYRFLKDKLVQPLGARTASARQDNTYYSSDKAVVADVQTVDNYKGTGRQLVIFKVKSTYPEGESFYDLSSYAYTGLGVAFYAAITYDDVLLYGHEGYNNMAYQRADKKEFESISYTENGCGSSFDMQYYALDSDGNPALIDVDGDGVTDKKDTLYKYAQLGKGPIIPLEIGLSKAVMGAGSLYTDSDTVSVGEDYTYKLTVQTDDHAITEGIVIADILENYKGGDGWKGVLKSIDVSRLTEAGAAPVVWYTTESTVDYHLELQEEGKAGQCFNPGSDDWNSMHWTTEMPSDASRITAVAVDARYDKNGDPFKVSEQRILTVFMTFTAPSALPDEEAAWNQAGYWKTFASKSSPDQKTEQFLCSKNTKLRATLLRDLEFYKLGENAEDLSIAPLGGAVFRLYKCSSTDAGHTHYGNPGGSSSCYGDLFIRETASMADGKVLFEDLEPGSYAFKESSVPTGCIAPGSVFYTFLIDNEGNVLTPLGCEYSSSKGTYKSDNAVQLEKGDDGRLTLLNKASVGKLTIYKTWNDNGRTDRPEAVFHLKRNGVPFRDATLKKGEKSVVIENLPVYDAYGNYYAYSLEEEELSNYAGRFSWYTNYPFQNGYNDRSVTVYNDYTAFRLIYVVAEDPVYGIPTDDTAKAPGEKVGITYNTTEKLEPARTTVERYAVNKDGEKVPGKWTFTGWSSTEKYTDTITEKNIRKDETVYGRWVFVPDKVPELTKEADDTSVETGQTVTFTVKGEVPDTDGYSAYSYIVKDTMNEGLKFDGTDTVAVKVGGADDTGFELRADGNGFVLSFDMTEYQDRKGKEILITYTATVTEDAVVKVTENRVSLTYSSDPSDSTKTKTTPDIIVPLYSSEIVAEKVNSASPGEVLQDAGFVLLKKAAASDAEPGLYYKYNEADSKVEWVEKLSEATAVITDEKGAAAFKGLEDGTYYLREIKAPDGFALSVNDIEITIDASGNKDTATGKPVGISHKETVRNNPGSPLPETGGRGTALYYITGSILLLAALLICKKTVRK